MPESNSVQHWRVVDMGGNVVEARDSRANFCSEDRNNGGMSLLLKNGVVNRTELRRLLSEFAELPDGQQLPTTDEVLARDFGRFGISFAVLADNTALGHVLEGIIRDECTVGSINVTQSRNDLVGTTVGSMPQRVEMNSDLRNVVYLELKKAFLRDGQIRLNALITKYSALHAVGGEHALVWQQRLEEFRKYLGKVESSLSDTEAKLRNIVPGAEAVE